MRASVPPMRHILVKMRFPVHKQLRFDYEAAAVIVLKSRLSRGNEGDPERFQISTASSFRWRASATVSTDGAVLARVDHEPTFGHFIADYDDLLRGWFALLTSARLTDSEAMVADAMFAERIGFYGEAQG